jgi:hypothetical protein
LSILHKSKDQNKITIETFKLILNQMKTINYLYTYSHLNLIEFDQFLDELIFNSKKKILVKRNDSIFYP